MFHVVVSIASREDTHLNLYYQFNRLVKLNFFPFYLSNFAISTSPLLAFIPHFYQILIINNITLRWCQLTKTTCSSALSCALLRLRSASSRRICRYGDSFELMNTERLGCGCVDCTIPAGATAWGGSRLPRPVAGGWQKRAGGDATLLGKSSTVTMGGDC